MPPRLQCLNAAQTVRFRFGRSGAKFSTSSKALAGDTLSSTEELLKIGENPQPATQRISLPIRNRRDGSTELRARTPRQQGNDITNKSILRVLDRVEQRRERSESGSSGDTLNNLKKFGMGRDLTKQIARRWKEGDVYAPHDLSPVEMDKWKKRSQPDYDVFDILDFNPIPEYKNFAIMSEYVTSMGRIKHSSETGLRPVNQRRIAKAIRRSIGLGLMPSVHRHPEILQKEHTRRRDQMSRNLRGPTV